MRTLRFENWSSFGKHLRPRPIDLRNELGLASHTGTKVKYPYVSRRIFEGNGPVGYALQLTLILGHATTIAFVRHSLR